MSPMLSLIVIFATLYISFAIKHKESPSIIRQKLHDLTSTGRMNDVIAYLNEVEKFYGTLLIDDVIPSLYSYKGVALYNGLRLQEAEEALKLAVKYYPKETRAWINLGELQVQTFKLNDASDSFNAALRAGDMSALPRALRTKGWSAAWENFEALTSTLERETKICVESMKDCHIDSSGGMEYCDIDSRAHIIMNSLNPNAHTATTIVPPGTIAPHWRNEPLSNNKNTKSLFEFTLPNTKNTMKPTELIGLNNENRRLKVGFMSADFGVHPVAQLVRGLFQFINTSRIEVYCFSLQSKVSWWGQNISETVDHFIWLQNMNTFDAAREISRLGVEILIDLNGHTMHSGLAIMTHKPSPLQMSFLGLPTTTAAGFIDYYIADSIAVPPEQQHHYSEQLVLMSDCYIANDYAQIQGDVLKFTGEHRAPREALKSTVALTDASFLFGTLSNSQKMDPAIFTVWMNILRRFPGSHLAIVEHAGSGVYMPHLHANGRSFGIDTQRLVGLKQAPWIDHLYGKTSFDLILDTTTKNGHTTGLDGVWAGVPTISLAGGTEAPARAAESIAVTLESTLGLAFSLKEYEDLAFAFAAKNRKHRKKNLWYRKPTSTATHVESSTTGSSSSGSSTDNVVETVESESDGERRLRLWREQIDSLRTVSNLFDMPRYEQQFTRLLQGTWELAHLSRMKSAFQPPRSVAGGLMTNKRRNSKGEYNKQGLFHIFTPVSGRYHSRGDASGEGDWTEQVSAPQLGNRDEQGRIKVYQTFSEGSMINTAAARLDSQSSADTTSTTSAVPTQHTQQKRETSKTLTNTDTTTSSTTAASSTTSYHPTGKGATGMQTVSSAKTPKRRYPSIPRYVFDGRLIMLNIGRHFTVIHYYSLSVWLMNAVYVLQAD